MTYKMFDISKKSIVIIGWHEILDQKSVNICFNWDVTRMQSTSEKNKNHLG